VAKLGPKQIAEEILLTTSLNAPPRPLGEVVLEVVMRLVDERADTNDLSTRWHKPVRDYLQAHWDESLDAGHQPRIGFNSSSDYMIQGACYVEPHIDSESVKEQKRQRLHWLDYYEALKNLSAREFEILCKRTLDLLGVGNAHLTRYTGDEGIDFFGRLSLGDLVGHGPLYPRLESSLEVWLLGQAKHYKKVKVATPDIRELVGAVNLGRAHAFGASDESKYEELRIRVCDPVFMLFFTTGEISVDGWRLSRRSGVIAMDGEMLAAFLADKAVGVVKKRGKQSFSPARFRRWLHS